MARPGEHARQRERGGEKDRKRAERGSRKAGQRQTRASFIQAFRDSVPSVAASSQENVWFTWPEPFPDTAYTVSAEVEQGATSDTLSVKKILERTPEQVRLRIQNNDNTQGRTGTIHLVGIPDALPPVPPEELVE